MENGNRKLDVLIAALIGALLGALFVSAFLFSIGVLVPKGVAITAEDHYVREWIGIFGTMSGWAVVVVGAITLGPIAKQTKIQANLAKIPFLERESRSFEKFSNAVNESFSEIDFDSLQEIVDEKKNIDRRNELKILDFRSNLNSFCLTFYECHGIHFNEMIDDDEYLDILVKVVDGLFSDQRTLGEAIESRNLNNSDKIEFLKVFIERVKDKCEFVKEKVSDRHSSSIAMVVYTKSQIRKA